MTAGAQTHAKPILLFDGECGVCRSIAGWVGTAARNSAGEGTLAERPIGDDPEDLRALNPELDIWDAYATIHVLMPDGSMKLGGEAVAEVLRNVPSTRWIADLCSLGILGVRPFQSLLDLGYLALADVRPILGCESCGTSNAMVRAIAAQIAIARSTIRNASRPSSHSTPSRRPRA